MSPREHHPSRCHAKASGSAAVRGLYSEGKKDSKSDRAAFKGMYPDVAKERRPTDSRTTRAAPPGAAHVAPSQFIALVATPRKPHPRPGTSRVATAQGEDGWDDISPEDLQRIAEAEAAETALKKREHEEMRRVKAQSVVDAVALTTRRKMKDEEFAMVEAESVAHAAAMDEARVRRVEIEALARTEAQRASEDRQRDEDEALQRAQFQRLIYAQKEEALALRREKEKQEELLQAVAQGRRKQEVADELARQQEEAGHWFEQKVVKDGRGVKDPAIPSPAAEDPSRYHGAFVAEPQQLSETLERIQETFSVQGLTEGEQVQSALLESQVISTEIPAVKLVELPAPTLPDGQTQQSTYHPYRAGIKLSSDDCHAVTSPRAKTPPFMAPRPQHVKRPAWISDPMGFDEAFVQAGNAHVRGSESFESKRSSFLRQSPGAASSNSGRTSAGSGHTPATSVSSSNASATKRHGNTGKLNSSCGEAPWSAPTRRPPPLPPPSPPPSPPSSPVPLASSPPEVIDREQSSAIKPQPQTAVDLAYPGAVRAAKQALPTPNAHISQPVNVYDSVNTKNDNGLKSILKKRKSSYLKEVGARALKHATSKVENIVPFAKYVDGSGNRRPVFARTNTGLEPLIRKVGAAREPLDPDDDVMSPNPCLQSRLQETAQRAAGRDNFSPFGMINRQGNPEPVKPSPLRLVTLRTPSPSVGGPSRPPSHPQRQNSLQDRGCESNTGAERGKRF